MASVCWAVCGQWTVDSGQWTVDSEVSSSQVDDLSFSVSWRQRKSQLLSVASIPSQQYSHWSWWRIHCSTWLALIKIKCPIQSHSKQTMEFQMQLNWQLAIGNWQTNSNPTHLSLSDNAQFAVTQSTAFHLDSHLIDWHYFHCTQCLAWNAQWQVKQTSKLAN